MMLISDQAEYLSAHSWSEYFFRDQRIRISQKSNYLL